MRILKGIYGYNALHLPFNGPMYVTKLLIAGGGWGLGCVCVNGYGIPCNAVQFKMFYVI